MTHTVTLLVLLILFWLFNSNHYSLLGLALGVTSIATVLCISIRMKVIDNEAQPLHLPLQIPRFYLWLLKEVILSNISVTRQIWRKTPDISPQLLTIKNNQQTDLGKVIYANSITLVPGTVTVNLQEDIMTVHALTKETAEDLQTGEMEHRINRMTV